MGDLANLPTFTPSPSAYLHTDFNALFQAITIGPAAVTPAKMQAVASGTLMGRSAAGAGSVEQLAPATARTLLQLGDAATKNVGNVAGAVCAGDDPRLVDSRKCNNTFDDATASRAALGLGSMAQASLACLESIVTAVNQTGVAPGTGMVFNTLNAPRLTLTPGKWLVIGTVAARMSDIPGACGFRFSDTGGINFFGAGVAPNLTTERSAVTLIGFKQVAAATTFDVFFYAIPQPGSTVNLGEATGISYAGNLLALRLEN